jgi:hypothetical protein
MHMSDETTGHVPDDLVSEIDDTDLSDEALDRGRVRGAHTYCSHGASAKTQP